MFNNQLFRQVFGTLNLACPFILLYKFAPNFALTTSGITLYGLLVGLYLIYSNYSAAQKQLKTLLYTPTVPHNQQFDQAIEHCRLDPKQVSIRYAYTGDNIAMTMFNSVILDPLVWKNIEDPELIKARDVVEKFIIPTLPDNKKALLNIIQKEMTPDAQKFIFRHELGHVFYNYSYKKILLMGAVGMLVACITLLFAKQVMPTLGEAGTFVICILLSCAVDLLLGFATNFFFKTKVEYNADIFATKFSTKAEIKAAAEYFEKYEQTAQAYRHSTNRFLNVIPTTILIGYIDGITRGKYLRDIAESN